MDKDTMVALTYTFIFSKSANLWNHVYQWENDLADFFAANGLEAEIVKTVEGSNGGRMMIIKKIDMDQFLTNTKGVNLQKNLPQGKSQKSSQIVTNLTNKLVGKVKGGKK